MCDLYTPALSEEKSLRELEELVRAHLEPQRSEIEERYVFRQRMQRQGETINEYIQTLKHLVKTYELNNIKTNPLEVCLWDQLTRVINSSKDMRSRLFAEKNLDYKRAVELALALETADRHATRWRHPVS